MDSGSTPIGQVSESSHKVPPGEALGSCSISKAATPATYGVAIEVPDFTVVAPYLAVVCAASMLEPGAMRSIPKRPSPVGPTLE